MLMRHICEVHLRVAFDSAPQIWSTEACWSQRLRINLWGTGKVKLISQQQNRLWRRNQMPTALMSDRRSALDDGKYLMGLVWSQDSSPSCLGINTGIWSSVPLGGHRSIYCVLSQFLSLCWFRSQLLTILSLNILKINFCSAQKPVAESSERLEPSFCCILPDNWPTDSHDDITDQQKRVKLC